MPRKNAYQKFVEWIERYLPMTFSSLVIFIVIIYLFVVIGKTIYSNYQSNKGIEKQENEVELLETNITDIQNKINYYQTNSYKEKEAREKLGYKAPGETVVSVPYDQDKDKSEDQSLGEVQIKTPNYKYWLEYFFE